MRLDVLVCQQVKDRLVEVPHPGHPLGVRGVGETPICGPMAAVTTALNHAVNTRVRDLPLTPSRVLAAIGARD